MKAPLSTRTVDDDGTGDAAGVRTTPFLFVLLEADRPAAGAWRIDLRGVSEITVGRGDRREARRVPATEGARGEAALTVRLPAPALSATHVRLQRRGTAWHAADLGSKNGTRVLGEAIARFPATRELKSRDIVEAGRCLLSIRWLVHPSDAVTTDLDSADLLSVAPGLATLDPHLAAAFERVLRVAAADVPLVLLGESGTGKERVARAVHDASRRAGPFVALNCGAIPKDLVEATLFGHVRGAFSGAQRDETGFVRAAHGGTLLLDEIGDLPAHAQAALLRVVQEREVVPVGAARPVPVDVRFIAATLRPLAELAAAGTFRADLLARLKGLTVTVPPLREREVDLGHIVATILREAAPAQADHVRLSTGAARALFAHDWPMNVRELRQTLGTALALSPDGVIRSEHLQTSLLEAPKPAPDGEGDDLRVRLVAALEEQRGNVRAVARALGRAPTQVYRWLERFGIDPDAFRKDGR